MACNYCLSGIKDQTRVQKMIFAKCLTQRSFFGNRRWNEIDNRSSSFVLSCRHNYLKRSARPMACTCNTSEEGPRADKALGILLLLLLTAGALSRSLLTCLDIKHHSKISASFGINLLKCVTLLFYFVSLLCLLVFPSSYS